MAKLKSGLKILLGVFFFFGGVMHFVNPGFYRPMMPDYLPAHDVLIALSGVTEIVAAVMLLIPKTSRWGAWLIFAQLLVFFSVHIWMIQRAHDLFKKIPLAMLWGRIVLQFVFLAWAYWFTKADSSEA